MFARELLMSIQVWSGTRMEDFPPKTCDNCPPRNRPPWALVVLSWWRTLWLYYLCADIFRVYCNENCIEKPPIRRLSNNCSRATTHHAVLIFLTLFSSLHHSCSARQTQYSKASF